MRHNLTSPRAGSLERGTSIYVDQGYVDARITYPISSPGSEFAIRTNGSGGRGCSKARAALSAVRRRQPGDGHYRQLGNGCAKAHVGTRRRRASRDSVARTFLTGYGHWLFLLCLVIPLRGWRQIRSVITVFLLAAGGITVIAKCLRLPSGPALPSPERRSAD